MKKIITVAALITTVITTGCASVGTTGRDLGNVGTAKVTIRYYTQDMTVTYQNGFSCKTPCGVVHTIDLSKINPNRWAIMFNQDITFTHVSGETFTHRLTFGRTELDEYGMEIPFALPKNHKFGERIAGRRAFIAGAEVRDAIAFRQQPAQQQAQAPQPETHNSESTTGSDVMELLNIFAAGYNEAAEERKRNTPVRSDPVQCVTDHMGSISVTNCR